jgi:hypothetical protein
VGIEGDWSDSILTAQTKVKMQTAKAGDNMFQRWKYSSTSKQILGVNGQCLDAGWTYDPNNRQLRVSDCNGGNNQQWVLDFKKRLSVLQAPQLCLMSLNGNIDNSYLYMADCNEESRQKWDLTELGVVTPPPPTWNNYSGLLRPGDNPNMAIDVYNSNPTDQSQVKLWNYNASNAQRWGFDWNTKAFKGLNDKCLDGGNLADLGNRWLRLQACHGGGNQRWFADQYGRIHSAGDENLCIESANGSVTGSYLYLATCHLNINQRWNNSTFSMEGRNWNPPAPVCNNCTPWTTVKSAFNTRYVWDLWGGGTGYNQQPIRMGVSNGGTGAENQKFQYNPNTREIRSLSNRCVDGGAIWNGPNPNNTWLRVNDCNGGTNQKWDADNYGRIHSGFNYNLCVDSAAGDNYGSTIYILDRCHYDSNQRWYWW